MKNKLISNIQKGFTKKDAAYLIVIGVMSGLLIGSFGNPGMHNNRGFDFKSAEQKNVMPGGPRDHQKGFKFDGDKRNKPPLPAPSVIPSPAPSASSGV